MYEMRAVWSCQYNTRQLPMGAGHCQWGGVTDLNVCNMSHNADIISMQGIISYEIIID